MASQVDVLIVTAADGEDAAVREVGADEPGKWQKTKGPDDFDVYDDYIGERYGHIPPATLEAIRLAARTDAIFLDPVYTGKAMSGLIGEIRKGRVKTEEVAVFVHTGGVPIIFAYHDELKDL